MYKIPRPFWLNMYFLKKNVEFWLLRRNFWNIRPFARAATNRIETAVEPAGCKLSNPVCCVQVTAFFFLGVNGREEKNKLTGLWMQPTGEKKVTEKKLVQVSFVMIELREVVDCSETSQHSNSVLRTIQ